MSIWGRPDAQWRGSDTSDWELQIGGCLLGELLKGEPGFHLSEIEFQMYFEFRIRKTLTGESG